MQESIINLQAATIGRRLRSPFFVYSKRSESGLGIRINLQSELKISPKKEPCWSGVHCIGGFSEGVFLSGNVGSQEAFRAFLCLKGNRLTFGQSSETGALDGAEMYEYILTAIRWGNKTNTFSFFKSPHCGHITLTLNKLKNCCIQVMERGIQGVTR